MRLWKTWATPAEQQWAIFRLQNPELYSLEFTESGWWPYCPPTKTERVR